MLEEILTGGFAELGLAADEEALARYRTYYERLSEVNKVMNLTAISGEEDTARLHFLDCAALLTALDLRGKRVIDVGTGAGFPGLAVKVACPDMDLTLLDSLDKRIGFLRETCAALDFDDVACIHARAEDAVARGAHYDGSREYRRYLEALERNPAFSLHSGRSVRYAGPDQLVSLGLMRDTPAWAAARGAAGG